VRRVVLSLIVAVAGLLTVGTAAGSAYHLGGKKWPTRTITYHSSASQYREAIREAVALWNASGVNVRFKATKRSRAKLRIVYGGRGGPSGQATLGWSPVLTYRTIAGVPLLGAEGLPCGTRVPDPTGDGTVRIRCEKRGPQVWLDRVSKAAIDDPLIRRYMLLTVVHELGHSLGLQHHHARCAVMSYRRDNTCPKPPVPWQYRCRLIERDDLKGALRRYGGTAKPLAPEFCDAYPPPAAPTALAATFDPAGQSVHASFVNGASANVAGVAVTFNRGSCLVHDVSAMTSPATPGAPEAVAFDATEPGRYCVTAWSEDGLGQVGPSVSTWIDVPPPVEDATTAP
jgi:hypothetical protein